MNDGAMRQYYPPMPGDEERGQPDRPDYKVYRSRPGLFSRLRSPDLSKLRERARGRPSGERGDRAVPGARPPWRRVLKWVGIVALAWLVISFIAFEVSSQIQKWKLRDMGDTLHGNPFLAVSPQTILVIGTDIRSGQFAGPAEADTLKCLDVVESGRGNGNGCKHGPYRSDTLLLIRAGGGDFRKLSIPRDALANIPGQGENKINSAYAVGGARLTVRTVEEFLGTNVDQVAIVDFDGFRKFIDTIGGVKVNLPTAVCSSVSGGAFNLKLSAGEHTLNGFQAITLARTRENTCGSGQFSGTDIERTEFQQLIIDGIKDRLTDPLRLPYNFIKGPFIAWNAPKVMVSSMGAGIMPQLVFAAAIGGGGSDVLKPSGPATAAGNLIIPQSECQRAVKQFLGKSPPHSPACSPPS
jgi:LCP family protein required for cell wall assembly